MNTSTFFNTVFSKAAKNAILILDEEGFILSVNDAFLKSFNYSTDKLIGKHFRMLFTEEARKNKKPEHELEQCKKTGSGNDENYLVCGDGTITWVSGESVYDSENKWPREHGPAASGGPSVRHYRVIRRRNHQRRS